MDQQSEKIRVSDPQTDRLLINLECPLCNNTLNHPKLCNCGHAFCLDCLQDYVKECETPPHCPKCGKVLKIPSGGVEYLPSHHFYEDLAKEVHALQNDNKLSRYSCKFCTSEEKLPASVKCIACQVPMCERCATNHVHNGVTNVVPIHRKQDSLLCDILPKRDTVCEKHPTESILLYCVQCKECICFKCKEISHSDHDVIDIIDAANESRESIGEINIRLKEYLNETKDAQQDIERISKEYKDNVMKTRTQIENQFQKLINHIVREKGKIIAELDEEADDVESRLIKCRVDVTGKQERAFAVADLATNLVRYGNNSETILYKETLNNSWREIKEDKLSRFGQGYKLGVQFFMNGGILGILSKDLASLRVTQNLSPWTSRKSGPMDIPYVGNGTVDASVLHRQVKQAISNDFSLKRSPIFARFVDPKWTLETYETCASTGQTVTVWMRSDEEQEQSHRASKRLSMRSFSNPSLIADIESFDEKGNHQYRNTFEKLPDGTTMRLSIAANGMVLLAVYPGLYASAIIGQAKLKSLSKKDVDGIYVAVLEQGKFICGELRKIPIPEGPGFDFKITSRGMIVVKPLLSQDIRIYSSDCKEVVTDHGQSGVTVKKLLESPDGHILAVCVGKEGNIFCERIFENGDRVEKFSFPFNLIPNVSFDFKDACVDRSGNFLFNLKAASQDFLYKVTHHDYRKEYLAKPDMIQKVDKLAVLPDGRICVFDKAECILMTLKYL